jgi:hypothetical protein
MSIFEVAIILFILCILACVGVSGYHEVTTPQPPLVYECYKGLTYEVKPNGVRQIIYADRRSTFITCKG